MDPTKLLLLAGAAYILYEYFYGSSSTTSTPSNSQNDGPTAPTIGTVSGTLKQGQAATLTVTVGNVTGTPSFVFNQTPVNVNLTGTAGVYTVMIPASLVTGTSGALGVSASNGHAAITLAIKPPPATTGGGSPTQTGVKLTGGSIFGGVTYDPTGVAGSALTTATTKAAFNTALIAALNTASGKIGTTSIDAWNWYMVNSINASYLIGGVGPDPTVVAAQIGIARTDSTSAQSYVSALAALNLIAYPGGLSGLAGLAEGINRVNKHPFAGRRVRTGKVVVQ